VVVVVVWDESTVLAAEVVAKVVEEAEVTDIVEEAGDVT
jgi:hypothetical protein